jgi:hypothetical protein
MPAVSRPAWGDGLAPPKSPSTTRPLIALAVATAAILIIVRRRPRRRWRTSN